jgi:signal transduction histidine kinase
MESSQVMAGSAESERVRERFERLLAATIAISAEHRLEDVLQQVVDSARAVVESRYAALGVLADDKASLSQFVVAGISPAEKERIGAPPTGKGLLGLAIKQGRPIRIANMAAHAEAAGFPEHHPRMTSFLGVPIKGRHQILGHLYLTDKLGAAAFSEEDEAIAVMLASQAAVAVENARLYEETTQLLHQLQSLQRQRDQFFAMINHELRNALTGVFGWAEQLRRARSDVAVQRAAREVYESAERTVTLMNNLLDLSRLDSGRVQAVFQNTDVLQVCGRATSVVLPAAESKRITIRQECSTDLSPVRTDGLRLEQILVNLLSNAVRHSGPGEDVIVRCERTVDELLVHVIDRGPGIPSEDQTRIFEPFIRVDPDTGLGSGLGLPVSRRMAELLGGRLTVSSALGRGATFTIAVPLSPTA